MAHLNPISSSEEQTPSDVSEDRLSNLPWHVLNIIFSFLPLLDAVKTSFWSRDWRKRWLSFSSFILDCNTIHFGRNTRGRKWEIVSSIINKYMLEHTGPIKKFHLRTNCRPHNPDLIQWIQYLSTQDVEEFRLQENYKSYFLVPSSLFSFKKLIKLFLEGCNLRIPSDFEGFNSLRSIFFKNSSVIGDDLNRFIASCPNLKKLCLFKISGLTLLRIHGLRLTKLLVDTAVENIVFEATPCLASVTFVDDYSEHHERVNFNFHRVLRSVLELDSITELGISGDMIKLLAGDYGIGNFPRKSNLKRIQFHGVTFDTVEVFHFCLSLLSSCSNVCNWHFIFQSAKGPRLIADFLKENRGRFCFPKLVSLGMMCPKGVGMGCMVNFLEFVGAHSPNLKTLTLLKEGGNTMHHTRARKLLTRLRKACPQASVNYVHDLPRLGKAIYYK